MSPVLPTLSRYVLREVLQLYAAGVALFIILKMTDIISTTVGKAMTYHASFGQAMTAFGSMFPTVLNLSLVAAVPFAILLGLSRLQKDSEIKAVLAAGVRPLNLVWPLILPCLVVGALTFVNAGWWVPAGLTNWEKSWYAIYGQQPQVPSQDRYTYAPQGAMYYAGRVTSGGTTPGGETPGASNNPNQTAQLWGVMVQRTLPTGMTPAGTETLTANTGTWNAAAHTWTLDSPWVTRPGQAPTQTLGPVVVPQNDTLQPPAPDPRKVSNAQLRQALASEGLTRDARRDYTYQLAARYADPFTPIAFALAAGSLGLMFRSRIAATGGVVVFIALFYVLWVTMPPLARAGALDPTLAAWIPSLLFLVVGAALAWRLC